MAGKSRPTSGKSPAAPVPLKADPPPSHKPAPRRASAPDQDAAKSQVQSPEPPKAKSPAESPGESQAQSQIEAQVEALLDEAEQQVQAMSELVGDAAPAESAPRQAASDTPAPGAAASDESAAPADEHAAVEEAFANGSPLDGPVDHEALQSQVDAILAEAGHAPSVDDVEDLPSAAPFGADDLTAGTAAGEERSAEAEAPPMDIAAVDAVIADAAQRAIEQDDFETSGSAAPREAVSPTESTEREGAESPRRVVKGGDASMRRVKPKESRRKSGDADLDGEFARPNEQRSDSAAAQEREALVESPAASEPPDPRLRARATRAALRGMAAMNEPWSRWTPPTRYMVLAFTLLNITLAGVAYIIVLSRWL